MTLVVFTSRKIVELFQSWYNRTQIADSLLENSMQLLGESPT